MYSAVLLNGGIGARVGSDVPKQLIRINGVPLFIYPLRVFDEIPEISQVILNYPSGWENEIRSIVKKYAIKVPIEYCEAGKTRQESVRKMLDFVKYDQVILHESARPLVSKDDFFKLINDETPNITMTLPIPFTVLKKDIKTSYINGNLKRDELVNILLPQKFDSKTLKECHIKAYEDNLTFTEDASVLFQYGYKIKCIEGDDKIFKVTTKQDVLLAENILNKTIERD